MSCPSGQPRNDEPDRNVCIWFPCSHTLSLQPQHNWKQAWQVPTPFSPLISPSCTCAHGTPVKWIDPFDFVQDLNVQRVPTFDKMYLAITVHLWINYTLSHIPSSRISPPLSPFSNPSRRTRPTPLFPYTIGYQKELIFGHNYSLARRGMKITER